MSQIPSVKVFDDTLEEIHRSLDEMRAGLAESYRWCHTGLYTTPKTTPALEEERVGGGDTSDPTLSAVTSRAGSRAEVYRAIKDLVNIPKTYREAWETIERAVGGYVPVKDRPSTPQEKEKARQLEAIEEHNAKINAKRLLMPGELEASKEAQARNRARGGGYGIS